MVAACLKIFSMKAEGKAG